MDGSKKGYGVTNNTKLKLLVVCPQLDGEDVGEAWCAYHWLKHLGRACDVTLLTLTRPGHKPPSEQLPHVRVIEWPAFPHLARFPRINSMIKPWYFFFMQMHGAGYATR